VSTKESDESSVMEEHVLFGGQFKGKHRNCGQIVHNAAQCKKKHLTMSETTKT
jgi:hypothetical protein